MKILKFVIAFIAVVAVIFTASSLRAGTGQEMRTFADLLFIVGGIIAALGALVYAGVGSRPEFGEWYGHSTRGPERQVEVFLEYREAQRRHGKLIIIFGLALIGLSILVGAVLL